MAFNVFLALTLLFGLASGDGAGNWGYKTGKSFLSPSDWKKLAGVSCAGVRQSPINIVTSTAQYWSSLKPLTLTQGQTTGNVLMKTSTTSFLQYFSDSWVLSFSGIGCLKPVAIHWHWGSVNGQGSEHTIDSRQYALEGHLVTYNCFLYTSATDATAGPSGLYVFSTLYTVNNANPTIEKMMPYFATVIQKGNLTVPEISPMDFLPKNLGSYYRYEGSLTTPPCTENVIWTVFTEIQSVSVDQIAQFRLLQFGHPEEGPMVDNYRPTMPMVSSSDYIYRVVYFSAGERNMPIAVHVSVVVVMATFICSDISGGLW